MEKSLHYFEIDGCVGGSQDWFTNYMMHLGGCAAATACDSCIYLAREKGMTELYPYHAEKLTRSDYVAFSQIMKPYLSPRMGGVSKLSLFMDGFSSYLRDQKCSIPMEGISGNCSVTFAEDVIKKQIDQELPVPCLLLRHKNKAFRDFYWHWFLLIGYEETEEDFFVTAATYGEATKLSLTKMWDTGYDEKGGIIRYF